MTEQPTSTRVSKPVSGWSVECHDCPHTIGGDYGEPIYRGAEFPATDYAQPEHEAEKWAERHRRSHPEHQPAVKQFQRWTMTVTDFDPDVLAKLFGPVGEREWTAHDIAQRYDEPRYR